MLLSDSHSCLQLYRDIVVTDFLGRKGLTLDQRQSVAMAMHHSMNMQERVYDRRTLTDKGNEGGVLMARYFEDAQGESTDSGDSEDSDGE